MRRIALVFTILVALTTSAFAQDQVATTTDMVKSADTRVQVGRLLGFCTASVDVIGMNLTVNDGVKIRDLYEVRRAGKAVAQAMVVYAGPTSTLLSLSGDAKNIKLEPTDTLVKVGHKAPPFIKVMPTGETVHVVERDFLSSRTYAPQTQTFYHELGISYFSLPGASFGGASFTLPGFSVPNFSGGTTLQFQPQLPNASFSAPTFTLPEPQYPSTVSGGGFNANR